VKKKVEGACRGSIEAKTRGRCSLPNQRNSDKGIKGRLGPRVRCFRTKKRPPLGDGGETSRDYVEESNHAGKGGAPLKIEKKGGSARRQAPRGYLKKVVGKNNLP